MQAPIRRFDGRIILGSRSIRSKTFAAFDWKEMVLCPGAEITRKADRASGQLRSFPIADHARLTAVLNHYSDVQSENSEDTVTWSVFGAIDPAIWLPDLLTRAFGEADRPTILRGPFWARIPHPDTTLIQQGPEAELTLIGSGWCYGVEAKWRQDIKDRQGARRDMTQIDMRAHTARTTAATENWGVLVVVPSPRRYPFAKRRESVFRRYFEPIGQENYVALPHAQSQRAAIITWEEILMIVCKYPSHKLVAYYLDWRLNLIDILQSSTGA
jgi:hypothetical protein